MVYQLEITGWREMSRRLRGCEQPCLRWRSVRCHMGDQLLQESLDSVHSIQKRVASTLCEVHGLILTDAWRTAATTRNAHGVRIEKGALNLARFAWGIVSDK